jgi:hypothetical protein
MSLIPFRGIMSTSSLTIHSKSPIVNLSPQIGVHMSTIGALKPPFKGGTTEYRRWYARLREQHRKSGSVLLWRTYYAKAKADALLKPPNVSTKATSVKLFGGALTPEYRRWYYRLQCEARATGADWATFFAAAKAQAEAQQGRPLPTTPRWTQQNPVPVPLLFGGASTPAYRKWYAGLRTLARNIHLAEQNWKSWFMQHKWDEMERQGLIEPATQAVNSSTSAQVQSKRATVVPFNPNRTSTAGIPFDGPLRFDFSVDNAEDREWR